MTKFDETAQRLVGKIKTSQTPVPGFIIGLSGTDSIMAFDLAYRAYQLSGITNRLVGVHYVSESRQTSWFDQEIVPWMRERYREAKILVKTPLGGNQDPQRWADLHTRALNQIHEGNIIPWEEGKNFWVAGTINATEKLLGRYSVLANSASIQLINNFWKSEVLEICREIGVPDIAMKYARLPDCICGRDELAAENIDLIDDILRFRVDATKVDPALLNTLSAYIADTKRLNDFKTRIPYRV